MGAPPVSPLDEAQLAELRAARLRGRKVARAAVSARVSGWITGFFAAGTLGWGVLSLGLGGVGSADWPAIAIGAGMVAVATGEFAGSRRLRRFDAGGARLLGCNQLAFGAMIVVYAAWMLLASLDAPVDEQLAAVDPEMAAWMADITRRATIAVYSGVALGGVLGPGAMALYYFTRARHVRRFVEQTPVWTREALRAAA